MGSYPHTEFAMKYYNISVFHFTKCVTLNWLTHARTARWLHILAYTTLYAFSLPYRQLVGHTNVLMLSY